MVLCVLALGIARSGRGVCCELVVSRVKCDSPPCLQWECDIDKVFALPPPSYSQGSKCRCPLKCQLVAGPLCTVCVCVCKLWPKGLFGQVLAVLVTLPFPAPEPTLYSSHASYSRYHPPCTLTSVHTHKWAHTDHARYTQSIIFTLTTGAVCKHRGLLTLKYSFADYPP